MVTNLPILVGDPVVCQVIVAKPFANPLESASDTCYPDDRFVPVGYPFQAKYDDYGYVDNIEWSGFVDDTLEFIRANLVELDQGENQCHDHEVRRDQLTWETFGKWLHGKRVLFPNPIASSYPAYPKRRSVGMVMIHQVVYEAMLNYGSKIDRRWRKDALVVLRDALKEKDSRFDFIARDKFRRFFREREFNNPRDLDMSVGATLAQLSEIMDFESAMSAARKQWHPISGAGSQSEEWDVYRAINQAGEHVANLRKAKIAEWEAEDEDDDNDD